MKDRDSPPVFSPRMDGTTAPSLRLPAPSGRPSRLGGAVALAGVAALLLAPLTTRAEPPSPDSTAPALAGLVRTVRQVDGSGRLFEYTFADPLTTPPMTAGTRVRVLLPPGYATATRRYPVLLLLHGAGDDAAAWTSNADGQVPLETFTAGLPDAEQAVVVMPDAGKNTDAGWYSDWFNGGAFGPPRWETFHIAQLLPWVEQTFRVRSDRGGRVVAGLSMGGYGAVEYAARHPDLFAAAFSFSGAVDLDALPYLEPAALAALHDRNGTPDDRVWGPWATQEIRWRGHEPPDLATNLRYVRLWLTTGMGLPGGPAPDDGDPSGLVTEAGVFTMNQVFVTTLAQAGISATYLPYPQGGHDWWHWQDDLHRAWPVIAATFADPTADAVPAGFDYRSIEPQFDIWGWHVTVHRSVVEFLALTGVTRDHLTLSGSGAVTLTTPPTFAPFTPYVVTVEGPTAGPGRQVVVADAAGRLTAEVTLGPSHTLQEDTPQARAAALDPQYTETAAVTITPAGPPGSAGPSASGRGPSVGVEALLPNTGASGRAGAATAAGLVAAVGGVILGRRRRPSAGPLSRRPRP